MSLRARGVLLALAALTAAGGRTLRAQEPQPLVLLPSYFADPAGVKLDFAWRFAPGDGLGWQAPGFDDRGWIPVVPLLTKDDLPAGGWTGEGWFRRHLLVPPALQNRPFVLHFESPGSADIYLDGRLVLSSGEGGSPPGIPWEQREASVVEFPAPTDVVAVHYRFPKARTEGNAPIGFRLGLADPAVPGAGSPGEPWRTGVEGALAALPFFLAIFHVILFGFDRRARENLFYAAEMAAFTVILLQEFHDTLLASDAQRRFLGTLAQGAPVVAVVFGLLTYYAVRTRPFPRSWRAFVGAAVALLALIYAVPRAHEAALDLFFAASVAEVVRVERSGATMKREGARFFMASLEVFSVAIVLQILINNGLLQGIEGIRTVYIFGILAFAVGMSVFLAYGIGRSRVTEAENARKTRELARARALQLSMLPGDLPAAPGLDVAAATHTATEVGGDFYDVRPAGDGGLLIAFGDATGHGLASGIVVTAAKALFHSLPADGPVAEMLASCNRAMGRMRLPGFQMCLALARVSSRRARLASAAMPPLLIHRAASGAVEEVAGEGLPLGTRLPPRYAEHEVDLAPGDTLLFASDGFAELRGPGEREIGYPGAAAAFREAARGGSARDVLERLGAAASAFRGTRPQDDDVTFLVVRVGADSA